MLLGVVTDLEGKHTAELLTHPQHVPCTDGCGSHSEVTGVQMVCTLGTLFLNVPPFT